MRMVLSSSSGVGTNEVAEVSVIEAIGQVCSYPCTHACVLTTINVVQERRSANCRVVIGIAVFQSRHYSRAQDHQQRYSQRQYISEERGIANGIVTESGRVIR